MLNEIGRGLRTADARVDARCGLHVHVDCRDFTFYDMRKLVKLYAHVEPALFGMMPGSRRRSAFCIPCGKRFIRFLDSHKIPKDSKKRLLTNLTDVVPNKTWRDQRVGKYGKYGTRYNALNLQSWLYRGTVEIRLHTGTVNVNKILCWALLWQSIVDYAYKATELAIDNFTATAAALPSLMSLAPSKGVREYIQARTDAFEGHGALLPKGDDDSDWDGDE